MPTVPFSLRIDSEIKTQLEREARSLDRSASYIANQAIISFLQARAYKRKAIQDAIVKADEGVFISSQAMGTWVDSWGTDAELSSPKIDIYPEK
ncbi:MAG: hypothetical protein V3V09_02790 [Arenicellales bacterium]